MQNEPKTTPSYQKILAQNAEFTVVNIALQTTVSKLEQELELSQFKIKKLEKQLYGKKSEQIKWDASSEQCNLFEEEESEALSSQTAGEAETIEIPSHSRTRSSKKSIPDNIPTEEFIYTPDGTHCKCCGGAMKEFSRDSRETLEYVPAQFKKEIHTTVHHSCCQCKATKSGVTPPEKKPVIPGSQIGAGFLAHMLTSRILDHLPYYRQSNIYERFGVYFPDKTLSRYGMLCGALLEPVAKAIKQDLLQREYLQGDETRLLVMDHSKETNTHNGQIWVLHDPLENITYYEYHKSRSQDAATALLLAFKGTLQSDGYVCYDKHLGESLGCNAHARRYFVEAREISPKESNHVLRLFGRLYKIEKELKTGRGNLKEAKWFKKRYEERQKQAVPILDKIETYLLELKDRCIIEGHPLYQAIHYSLNRFDDLKRYTTDGKYEIDNSSIERQIRPIAVGRRNWLFAGSPEGAKMSAVLMTVIHTCKQKKIDPLAYLADVLPRLADQATTSLKGLTPLDWVKP